MKRLITLVSVTAAIFVGATAPAPADPPTRECVTENGTTTCTFTNGRVTCTVVFVDGEEVSRECTRPGRS
jgi:hypothetical protein